MDGIVVPGGFGYRGVEGKILAAQFARVRKIPYLGLCLGMQVMSIEFARNVLELEDANSAEFETGTEHPVIDLMLEQRHITDMGGTMRLGIYPCKLTPDSVAARAYGGVPEVEERHRHRFELNNTYRTQFEHNGMRCTGISPDGQLVEIAEIEGHPFMVGSQFHPEFLSRPNRPHPLFSAFLEAAISRAQDHPPDSSETHPNGYRSEEFRDETELGR
jgi:CTP synthase